jgi:2',3'-cyclic-nucleotide 2'-phosphodiesterase (5'-nucleotidase family)
MGFGTFRTALVGYSHTPRKGTVMTKLTVITDANGKLVGTVRSDSPKTGNITIKNALSQDPNFKFQEVEIADEVIGKGAAELHKEVRTKIGAK